MTGPLLLRGVDLAAFAAALVTRLRVAGVAVSPSGSAGLVQAMRRLVPHSRTQLYWAARLTLVNRADDLASFDAVFAAVFADAFSALARPSRQRRLGAPAASAPVAPADDGPTTDGVGLPW
ncbi:MAG TPA: VWA containing CoxE family protein, partial [Mycobacterium sp.]|nr:VWA containing CoxE family protein [Mycobacterium sp.]